MKTVISALGTFFSSAKMQFRRLTSRFLTRGELSVYSAETAMKASLPVSIMEPLELTSGNVTGLCAITSGDQLVSDWLLAVSFYLEANVILGSHEILAGLGVHQDRETEEVRGTVGSLQSPGHGPL